MVSAKLDPTTRFTADGLNNLLRDVTGAYDSVENTGGYGAPNPNRAGVYLVVASFKLKSPSSFTPMKVLPYNGLADSEFSVALSGDGDYQSYLIPVIASDPADTTTVWFDSLDGQIKQDGQSLLDTTQSDPYTAAQIDELLLAINSVNDDNKHDLVDLQYQNRRARLVLQKYSKPCKDRQGLLNTLRSEWESARYNFLAERYFDSAYQYDMIEDLFNSVPELR